MSEETYTPDKLIAGNEIPALTEAATLLSGQNLARGAVLGAVTKVLGNPSACVGTGNGTVTGAALKSLTKVGTYTLTCIAAATDAGTFSVVDPDGVRLDDAKVGVAYANNHIGFTINDGSTDFTAGAKFTIAVTAGSGKLKLLDKTAVDGSQNPAGVLYEACDASGGDKPCVKYDTGIFNRNALVFADGTVYGDVAEAFRARGVFLRDMRTL